jgi:hypothetical protein
MLRQPHAYHRNLLAGPTAQAPPDETSGEGPRRHLTMRFSEPSPRKPIPLSGRSSADHGSGRSDAAFTTHQPYQSSTHRPADHKNASPLTRIVVLTAQSTLAADLSCGPPTANSPWQPRGHRLIRPLPAVSSLGGFQTPAAVRVEMFVTAGVWKPSQLRKSVDTNRSDIPT